jgi:mono/diheme cytochrome c family protein
MRLYLTLFFALLAFGQALPAWAEYTEKDDPTPSLDIGAQVFGERCVLCHGELGMGKGALPLRLADYPNTSLTAANKAEARSAVLDAIAYGGAREGISVYMPPFGKELTWTEIESVTDFIMLFRKDQTAATNMLDKLNFGKEPSMRLGRQIFSSRCVLCHGNFGEGDGRMAKLLKSPPPADLTASRQSEAYLHLIISKGGEAVGRSKHMPPWGQQLSDTEIRSVVLFLKSIRD